MVSKYVRPELVEYGRVEQLTLGQGGTLFDSTLPGSQRLCNPNGDPGIVCVSVLPT